MVQQFQSPIRVYHYPWELIMEAYSRRFPTSPRIPVMLASTIVSSETSADEAITVTERRCELNVDAPALFRKLLGQDTVFFIQKNTVNRRERSLVIEARNESFANRVSILEGCSYKVHPENPHWTIFEQSAELNIKSFLGMESQIEKVAIKQYLKNIEKGKEMMMEFIQDVLDEGITYIAPFDTNEPSQPIDESMLDDDYIRANFGELGEIEKSALIMLRRNLLSKKVAPFPSNNTLMRFLRGYSFDVEKAQSALMRSLSFRGQHQVDTILQTWQAPILIRDYLPLAWHKTDREGRPLLLARPGQCDMKGLIVGARGDLLRHMVWINERGLKLCEEVAEKQNKPMRGCTCIADLEGLGISHLWQPGLRELKNVVEAVQLNYPEMLDQLIIVRAPRMFPVLWTIIQHFVEERTRNKIRIFAGEDHTTFLKTIVDDNVLPDWLGGLDNEIGLPGGTIPVHLYTSSGQPSSARPTIYQSVTIGRGAVFRHVAKIAEADSAITFDFTVNNGVTFTVYHTTDAHPDECSLEGMTVVYEAIKCQNEIPVRDIVHCKKAGSYVLAWDNTGSWLQSKQLDYNVSVVFGSEISRSMSSLHSEESSSTRGME